MVGKILLPEIKSLIEARNFGALRELFHEWRPADVAEVILDMDEDDQVIIFRVLPHALAADVFEYLDFDAQQKLLRAMAHEQVVAILNEMSPDDRTALLEELPSAAARQLIRLLTPEERRIAQALLGYPEGSVGRLMTPDFIAVYENWTVQQVLDYIREHGQDSETLNVIYVVDERGKLIDDIRMREFLLKPLTSPVRDLMQKTFVALNVTDSQQEALNVFRKYDRTALPVVTEVRDLSEAAKHCPACGKAFAPFPGAESSDVIEIEVQAHIRRIQRPRPHAPARARRGRIPGARVSRVTVTRSTAPGQGDIFIDQLAVTFSLDSDICGIRRA